MSDDSKKKQGSKDKVEQGTIRKRESFSKKSHIGESKAQQEDLRKGGEVEPRPKKKK